MVALQRRFAGPLGKSNGALRTEGVVDAGVLLEAELVAWKPCCYGWGFIGFVLGRLERLHKSEALKSRERSWNFKEIISFVFSYLERADSAVLCGLFEGRNHQ